MVGCFDVGGLAMAFGGGRGGGACLTVVCGFGSIIAGIGGGSRARLLKTPLVCCLAVAWARSLSSESARFSGCVTRWSLPIEKPPASEKSDDMYSKKNDQKLPTWHHNCFVEGDHLLFEARFEVRGPGKCFVKITKFLFYKIKWLHFKPRLVRGVQQFVEFL